METRAIRVHQPGGPEVMRLENVVVPELAPHEVLLRHTAIGVNFIDCYHRSGLYPLNAPFTPGTEAAGVVEAVGAHVATVRVGERVAYCGQPLGAYAERRAYPADRLVSIPEGVSDAVAAAVMLQGMTAHYLLFKLRSLNPGETVLVHAAAGGVGLWLCQWARHLGLRVIGTVSTEVKAALALAHGCTHVLIHGQQPLVPAVKALTHDEGVSVVFDSVGRDTFMASLDCLKVRGLMVSFGQSSGPVPPFEVSALQHRGSLSLTRPALHHFIHTRQELQETAFEVFSMVQRGLIKVGIHQSFPLEKAVEAHRALEGRLTTGKTLLTC